MKDKLIIIGGGLAGTEAAWQSSKRGVQVVLYEMRPKKSTPAHQTDLLAELVCSNSLKSNLITNASGLLKEELPRLDSLLLRIADKHTVPAGKALAVDRIEFATEVTNVIERTANITVIREEVTTLPEDTVTIIATGPLTSPALATAIQRLVGTEYLYFYDAIAPIVTAESLDYTKIFRASRYRQADDDNDYLNCPLTEEQYLTFYQALIQAEQYPTHKFEDIQYFEGCLPIEELARRGKKTLLFGPMRPVGLIDPCTGKRPFAVVQLRQENRYATMYNLVGFQTKLKHGEQQRVFKLIPGLEDIEIVRYGSVHRNTYINAPKVLNTSLQFYGNENLFFAGQLTGVEGYVESIGTGLLAGINAARRIRDLPMVVPPPTTALGSLYEYLVTADASHFQPMNINLGLLPPVNIKKKELRVQRLVNRALTEFGSWIKKFNL